MIIITNTPAKGVIIKADTVRQTLANLKETAAVCFCNCNYVKCSCNCNYCGCNCNYCSCDCNYQVSYDDEEDIENPETPTPEVPETPDEPSPENPDSENGG